MQPSNPVGVFDSGVGGLSVWCEMVKLLPHEHSIYYADSAFCPYGVKKPEEIIARCERISNFLLSENCKMIVVACNTATAAAIDHLRATCTVPLVGMEPAVKPAALHSSSGIVGVLATRSTFKGRLYHETSERFAANVQIIEQAGDGLVELVEAGKTDSEEVMALLKKYIEPMLEAGIDHLVLGCTHYLFLIPAIQKITAHQVKILNSAPAVAKRIQFLLNENNMLNTSGATGRHLFFSGGMVSALEMMIQNMNITPALKQQLIYKNYLI